MSMNNTAFPFSGDAITPYELLCPSDFLPTYGTVRRIVMWLFCPSLLARLLIPVRDQSFQRESDPHMIHIIHHDW